jgi:hypothetical protein
MTALNIELFDKETAIVNVGDDGGYVMVELMDKGGIDHKNIEITVFNDNGDVISCYSMNLLGS